MDENLPCFHNSLTHSTASLRRFCCRQFHNFINVFMYEFFVRMSFQQPFLVTFWLWRLNLYEKRARKCWWNWHLVTLQKVLAFYQIFFPDSEYCHQRSHSTTASHHSGSPSPPLIPMVPGLIEYSITMNNHFNGIPEHDSRMSPELESRM